MNDELKEKERVSADFLLAELKYLNDCFWENEELGDRRVNFFVTITAAVIGVSVALIKGNSPGLSETFIALLSVGLLGWLIFGIATLIRMARRNMVTDDYKRRMNLVRAYFAQNYPDTLEHMGFRPDEGMENRRDRIFSIGNGGLVETVALVNSVIVSVIVAGMCFGPLNSVVRQSCPSARWTLYGLIVVLSGLTAWGLQMRMVHKRYNKENKTR